MRLRTDKLRNTVATYWQPTVFYGLLIVFFGALLWFKLGTLVGGYSPDELAALKASNSLRHILENPINAPFALLAYLFGSIPFGSEGMFPLRAAATAFGLLTLTTFYWLARHWHGERSAIFGTTIFGCSAWFLHTTRLGTPEVLLFLLLALAAASVWLKRTHSRLVLIGGLVLAAALLYIPGMIWMVLIGAVWQGKVIMRLFKKRLWFMVGGSVGFTALLAPLGLAIYKSPELAKVVVGLPQQGWPQITDVLQRLAHVPYNLFVRGPLDPEHWLGRLAVLDAFTMVMFALGLYLYIRHFRLVRAKLVGAALIVGTLLIGLGGAVNLSILIPFIYLVAAAGMGFLLDRWQKVFPRNIIAQGVGVGLISLAVVASSWYGLRHYFVAWPNAPATKQVFTLK
jgi:hypothetical protein